MEREGGGRDIESQLRFMGGIKREEQRVEEKEREKVLEQIKQMIVFHLFIKYTGICIISTHR